MQNLRKLLEARVGIGQLTPYFQGKSTPLAKQIQHNLTPFNLNQINPLTEDFTEGFGPDIPG
jgi:hypothetical protein